MNPPPFPTRCQRCGGPGPLIGSYFNIEMICLACEDRERAHPKYADAKAAELAQVKAGNLNYQGIGLPPELRSKPT